MGSRRRQRPGAGRAGTGRPARPGGGSAKPDRRAAGTSKPDQRASGIAKPDRRAAGAGGPAGRQARAPEPAAGRVLRALNPRKTPTRSRVRVAALLFVALAVVLGILGITVSPSYLPPAALTAILALLWGLRSLTMR